MKVFKTFAAALVLLLFFSCDKENIQELPNDNPSTRSLKGGVGIGFGVSFNAGHVKGSPLCCAASYCLSYPWTPCGSYIHIGCIGPGENCEWTVGLSFSADDGSGIVILDESSDYSLDFFHFPSFSHPLDDGTFFNMPEQMSYKAQGETGNVFSFVKGSITATPIY